MLVAFDVSGEAEGVAEAKHSSDVMFRGSRYSRNDL